MGQNATAIGAMPVREGELPCEGQKAVPFTLDFGLYASFDIDLNQQQQQKLFTSAQGAYIDNSDNADVLEILCGGTNQRVIFPANSCGYVPLLLTTPATLTINSPGGVVVQFTLLNFYIPPTIWAV